MTVPRTIALALLGLALGTLGCADLWRGRGGVHELAKMSDADGNAVYLFADIDPESVLVVPPPEKLRPCCAFGSGLGVSIGEIPLRGFSLDNVVSLDDLGRHNYDNGILSVGGSEGAVVSDETNGLLYTCHGGFIDTAHLRDYADWMMFFTTWVARHLETGGEIALSSEGGVRRVVLEPVPERVRRSHQVRGLALGLAEHVTFRLSIWHEIATWYGWSAIRLFPERASAFSPEDLYSNLLGVKIVRSMVEVGATGSEEQYNKNLDRWMREVLKRLGALDAESSIALARALDGSWWDSTKRLPDPSLVRRRYMEIGPEIRPWHAWESGSPEAVALVEELCPNARNPYVMGNPERLGATELSSLIRLEMEIDPELVGFPLPRPPSRIVTHDDFPAIVEQIRQAAYEEFGPDADRPEAAVR